MQQLAVCRGSASTGIAGRNNEGDITFARSSLETVLFSCCSFIHFLDVTCDSDLIYLLLDRVLYLHCENDVRHDPLVVSEAVTAPTIPPLHFEDQSNLPIDDL
jgi:hypothetical protein